jgi:hypothetical protein
MMQNLSYDVPMEAIAWPPNITIIPHTDDQETPYSRQYIMPVKRDGAAVTVYHVVKSWIYR